MRLKETKKSNRGVQKINTFGDAEEEEKEEEMER